VTKRTIGVEERLPALQTLPLSFQHLFAMFGATILVPILTGFPPAVALLTSGIGTLLYILCTKARVPAYVGSSFAFIGPFVAVSAHYGQAAALGGGVAAGLVFVVVAALIRRLGSRWINDLLPPAVIGAVVIVIGLSLAPIAVQMAGLSGAKVSLANPVVQTSLFTLALAVLGSVFFKGFLGVIPILVAVIAGYGFAWLRGLVSFAKVAAAPWFGVPHLITPHFVWPAILAIAPVAMVTITENIGHLLVTGEVTGRDFVKDPGLDRAILGDGVATVAACLIGGPPNTTYGENIGVMAITRVYSVWVIGGAAVLAVVLSFVEKLSVVIQTIPQPVMGGVSLLLFGVIASSGLRMLVESGVDFSSKRNLILASVVTVVGVGGAKLGLGGFTLDGMALATLAGILLNLILPKEASGATGLSRGCDPSAQQLREVDGPEVVVDGLRPADLDDRAIRAEQKLG
jgi:uracil permease